MSKGISIRESVVSDQYRANITRQWSFILVQDSLFFIVEDLMTVQMLEKCQRKILAFIIVTFFLTIMDMYTDSQFRNNTRRKFPITWYRNARASKMLSLLVVPYVAHFGNKVDSDMLLAAQSQIKSCEKGSS